MLLGAVGHAGYMLGLTHPGLSSRMPCGGHLCSAARPGTVKHFLRRDGHRDGTPRECEGQRAVQVRDQRLTKSKPRPWVPQRFTQVSVQMHWHDIRQGLPKSAFVNKVLSAHARPLAHRSPARRAASLPAGPAQKGPPLLWARDRGSCPSLGPSSGVRRVTTPCTKLVAGTRSRQRGSQTIGPGALESPSPCSSLSHAFPRTGGHDRK